MKLNIRTALLSAVALLAFNNQAGWKTDTDGKIELKDGNPIYINASGQEMTVQHDTISRLNGEAKSHREGKEAAELKLKSFEGLDAAAARDAIEKLSKIDQKALIDAGKVDEVKAQITASFTAQIAEKDKALEAATNRINNMLIDGVFANSEFVRDNVALPRDMFVKYFRDHFKIEGDKIVAYDKSGNVLYSKQSVGNVADPEEAIRLLVDQHPQKDIILKANAGNGTGNNGNGGNGGRGRTIKRSEFETLAPMKQQEVVALARKGEMTIVD